MEFKIQNMVGSCDVKFPIRLEGLVVQHQQFCRCVHCTIIPHYIMIIAYSSKVISIRCLRLGRNISYVCVSQYLYYLCKNLE